MADLNTLIDYYNEHGRSPGKRDIKGHDALARQYGSWNAALEAAGLPINIKFTHTEEELINSLNRFFNENGKSPRASDCNVTDYLFDTRTYLRKLKCKTWAQVLRKANLEEYFEISTLNSLPDEELLSLIKTILTVGGSTKQEFYDKNRGSLPAFTTLQLRFGKWSNILKRLNIRPNLNKYSDDELLSFFYEAKEHFGYVPSSSELESYSNIPVRQWTKRFGAYNVFLQNIGEQKHSMTPDIVKESDEELKQLYIRFSEKHGYTNGATSDALDSSDEIYNTDVYTLRFGSINRLREACGYEPLIRGKKKYNSTDVFKHLRKIQKQFGRIPTITEYNQLPDAIPVSSLMRVTCSTGFQGAFEKAIEEKKKQQEYAAKFFNSNKGKLRILKNKLNRARTEEKRDSLIAEIETISKKIEEEEKLKKIINTKRCRHCGIEKHYTLFNKLLMNKDGLTSYCKDCSRQIRKELYSKGKVKKYNYDYEKSYIKKYAQSIKGIISELKRQVKRAKKESTKEKLLFKIAELEKQLEQENKQKPE